jgi:tyrosine-specific transport protein
VIAFGFHNMIPSLFAYMEGDLKRVRWTIIGGSLMAFVIYLIWEILVLGVVPLQGPDGLLASFRKDQEASQALAAIVQSPWIKTFSQGLAFFAILTSFLAQALSLVHFLADGLRVSYKKKEHIGLCALALIPPLILSLIYPQLFFKALNFAGGICAVILFGLLPVSMVWIGRYRKNIRSGYEMPGGKTALALIFLFALFIFCLQISSMV